ncbi:hypothetical protein RRG08_054297 [Elysia crispata]|uniref:Uncharacterized protein n=1 Tax=Elysia crispata TaxID=231223 RepID=A0AAE1ALF2_9GAST|nr:hypothetical protein RRG08_054297 [Elysia crispata]
MDASPSWCSWVSEEGFPADWKGLWTQVHHGVRDCVEMKRNSSGWKVCGCKSHHGVGIGLGGEDFPADWKGLWTQVHHGVRDWVGGEGFPADWKDLWTQVKSIMASGIGLVKKDFQQIGKVYGHKSIMASGVELVKKFPAQIGKVYGHNYHGVRLDVKRGFPAS